MLPQAAVVQAARCHAPSTPSTGQPTAVQLPTFPFQFMDVSVECPTFLYRLADFVTFFYSEGD